MEKIQNAFDSLQKAYSAKHLLDYLYQEFGFKQCRILYCEIRQRERKFKKACERWLENGK